MFDHFALAWECCAPEGKVFSLVSIIYLDTYIKAFAETFIVTSPITFSGRGKRSGISYTNI